MVDGLPVHRLAEKDLSKAQEKGVFVASIHLGRQMAQVAKLIVPSKGFDSSPLGMLLKLLEADFSPTNVECLTLLPPEVAFAGTFHVSLGLLWLLASARDLVDRSEEKSLHSPVPNVWQISPPILSGRPRRR